MKDKTFSYLRVSGKGQIDGDGFKRQQETMSKYAKANRLEIVREFRDEGVSGTKEALDRPGLTDLFVALKANGVRLVLVENATRIARDLMVSEIILAEFRKLGVKVVSADGGVDLIAEISDPESRDGLRLAAAEEKTPARRSFQSVLAEIFRPAKHQASMGDSVGFLRRQRDRLRKL